MITIWKFPLKQHDFEIVKMPKGPRPITVKFQQGKLMLWAVVDTESPMVKYRIWIVGTGRSMEHLSRACVYVGSAIEPGGVHIPHVFIEEMI